jgi:protein-S-isoprenylcysteine O-methyltransferase Ste14
MYLGIILVYISSSTIFNEMFFINLLCIICYIEVGSFYEEKTLLITFKTKYKNYQLKTYKYLPFIR